MTSPNRSTRAMRIIELQISNIKRIIAVAIAPNSPLVRINGENGSGKTSTLDGILWAFEGAGSVDLKPVRDGEERGSIVAKIGDDDVKFIVTRTFTVQEGGAKTTTKLTVETPEGALYTKPQQKLNELFGSISLDPQEFQRMPGKDRLNALKQIVVLDVDIDNLDALNAGDFERRTQINREIESAKGRVSIYAGGVKPEMDVNPIDVESLIRQMEEATARDRARDAEERRRASAMRRVAEGREYAKATRERAEQLRREIAILDQRADESDDLARIEENAINALPPLSDPIDISDLSAAIQDGSRENQSRQLQRTQRANHAEAMNELNRLTALAETLTAKIDERKRQKASAVAGAKFPVPGLSFGDDGVLFNGLPFDQASGAEQLRVSFAIAAAMKPKLPVVLIKDGSLLDDKSMALLEQLAVEYDAQVWIERVGADDVGIVLEEGEVVAVDGRPVNRLVSGELRQDAD